MLLFARAMAAGIGTLLRAPMRLLAMPTDGCVVLLPTHRLGNGLCGDNDFVWRGSRRFRDRFGGGMFHLLPALVQLICAREMMNIDRDSMILAYKTGNYNALIFDLIFKGCKYEQII
jgi:hypothetical protein